jgi:hypothetical protein
VAGQYLVDRRLTLPTNLDALSAQFRDVMGRPYRAIRPDGGTKHQAMTYPVPCGHTLVGYVRIERTTHSTSTGSTGGIRHVSLACESG